MVPFVLGHTGPFAHIKVRQPFSSTDMQCECSDPHVCGQILSAVLGQFSFRMGKLQTFKQPFPKSTFGHSMCVDPQDLEGQVPLHVDIVEVDGSHVLPSQQPLSSYPRSHITVEGPQIIGHLTGQLVFVGRQPPTYLKYILKYF